MSILSDALERLRALLFRGRMERELDEEMQFHLERESSERIRAGMDPAAARRAARMALSVAATKEEVRDARGVRPIEEAASDLRYALRGLTRNPGFTGTALVVLGLGLGAATTMFSVLNSVVLADLPYPEPERLLMVFEQNSPTNRWNISNADAQAIRDQQRSFEAFGAVSGFEGTISGAAGPERLRVGRATSGVFTALGVGAASGRLIEPKDEATGSPPVLVVTHALAERTLGGPGSAVGRFVMLEGVSHEVIGVLPPGRDDLVGFQVAAWTVQRLPPPVRRGPFPLRGIARLKPGVTLEQAAQDLAVISERLAGAWSDFGDKSARLTPYPLRESILGQADRHVGLFAAAVALVLLLAITNVATLALARASAREPELAVRKMLGAARGRIARLLLTESLLLTLGAAGVGLLVAFGGLEIATALAPNLPRIGEAGLDGATVLFALAASLLSGMLIALSPIAAARAIAASLRPETRGSGTGRRAHAVRGAMVVAQFALALPLLMGAGLLLNSFLNLQRVDPGFDSSGVVAVTLALPQVRYPDQPSAVRFWQQAEQIAAQAPGAVAVGITSALPPDNGGNVDNFNLMDYPVAAGESEHVTPWTYVTAGYFEAMGIPVLEGRLFTLADSANGPPVTVVSRAWAARYFPRGESPVGRLLVQGGCYDCPRTTIVGVVGDVKYLGLAGNGEGAYGPMPQAGARRMSLVVKSTAAPAQALRGLRENLRGLDSELAATEITLAEGLRDSLADPRRWSAMLAGFAGVSLGLAAFGVFGLMSYLVRQRRREIGLRLALGAQPGAVTRLVIRKGLTYAAIGLGLGLGLAFVEARWLRNLLFEVTPGDPRVLAGAAFLLVGAAFIASWLPGRKAARIPAVEAIQSE